MGKRGVLAVLFVACVGDHSPPPPPPSPPPPSIDAIDYEVRAATRAWSTEIVALPDPNDEPKRALTAEEIRSGRW